MKLKKVGLKNKIADFYFFSLHSFHVLNTKLVHTLHTEFQIPITCIFLSIAPLQN